MYQTLIKPLAQDIKTFILDTLFPISCLVCEQEGSFICAECAVKLTPVQNQFCIACHKPAPFGLTHPGCQTPQGADGLISFFDYHDKNVAEILIKGKYSFIPGTYGIFGKILAEKIKNHYQHLLAGDYTLVPVPLAASRKRWRGFNQAEVLCQALSLQLGFPFGNLLVRTKTTKTQKDLKKDQRVKNVSDAFAVSPPFQGGVDREAGRGGWNFDSHPIKNKNLILVDDVTTTGSTLNEAAKVLKRNGAEKVLCLTVARD